MKGNFYCADTNFTMHKTRVLPGRCLVMFKISESIKKIKHTINNNFLSTINVPIMKKTILHNQRFLFLIFLLLASVWGQAATFWSRGSGPWSTPSTWTTIASGNTTAATTFPQSGDIVFIENGDKVTLTANAAAASITINNTSNSTSSISNLDVATYTLTVTGNVILNTTGNNSQTQLDVGNGIIYIGGTLSNTTTKQTSNVVVFTTGTMFLNGASSAWSFNGAFTSGTGTVNFSGANTTITTATTFNNLTVSAGTNTVSAASNVNGATTVNAGASLDVSSSSVTINGGGSLVVNGTLIFSNTNGRIITGTTGSVVLTMGATGLIRTVDELGLGPAVGASLQAGTGTTGTWNVTSISTNGTIEYYFTGAQNITARQYQNLTLSGSGAKTVTGVTISGTGKLSMQGTATATGTAPTFDAGATLEYAGSAAQTVSAIEWPTLSNVPTNVTINNAAGVSLGFNNRSISGILTLTAGVLSVTSPNSITITNNAQGAIVGGSTTSYVSGILRRQFPADITTGTSTYIYPVGKGGEYLPLTILNPRTGATAPVVTVEAFNTGSGGSVDGTTVGSLSTSEYWSVTATGNLSSVVYNLTRQAALGNLNLIATSATQTGTYSSIGGSPSGTSINGSVASGTGFLSMGQSIASVDYRTNGNANTNAKDFWQYYNGASFVNAMVSPFGTNNITVSGGDSLTITDNFNVSVNKTLSIASSGKIAINPNVILQASGTLAFNNQRVVVKSTSDGSGSIGQISGTGSVTGNGNIRVERFISASTNRGYRQLTPSVTTTNSINANWQEGVNNTSFTAPDFNKNPAPGYGTHITGNTDGANGLDATQKGSVSLYTLNSAQTAWDAVLNTTTPTLNAKTGYLIYLRGNRSVDLNSNTSSNNTTLRATGTLPVGNQVYNVISGKYNLITNPYASAINWTSIYGNAGNSFGNINFVYWDPNVNQPTGVYVSVSNTGSVSNGAALQTNGAMIQTGQAFWVSPAIATVTIREEDKAAINSRDVFRTNGGAIEMLHISLYYNNTEFGRVSADGALAQFGNDFSAAVDRTDAPKFANFNEDVAILRNGNKLAIEARPLIDQVDTLPIYMAKMKQQAYEWQFDPRNFNAPGLQAYLQDKFLNNERQISLDEQTVVNFTVTADAASSASDRFRIVFRTNTVLPINFTNVKAFEKGSAIQVEWNLGNEQNVKHYEVEKSIDGRSFTQAGIQGVRNVSSTSNYQFVDATPNTGNNYYRIKAIENGGLYKYSQVVNVKTGKGNSAISVYPNPVKGKLLNVQFINQPSGKYAIKLINNLGQEVYRSEFNHIGGSASETLNLGNSVVKGIYQLQVKGTGNTITKVVVE